jgi:hypothetical protein
MREAHETAMVVLEQQPPLECPNSVCTPAPGQGQRRMGFLAHASTDDALMDPVGLGMDVRDEQQGIQLQLSLNATRAVRQIAAAQAGVLRRAAAR